MTKPDPGMNSVAQELVGFSLSRRALLGRLVITLVATAWTPRISSGPVAQDLVSSLGGQLLELALRLDLSKKIGKLYLRSPHGMEEIDERGILAQLELSILEEEFDPDDSSVLHSTLAKRISKDFRDNRICYLEDWQLSLTECRLAALNYLSDLSPQQATESAPTLQTLASVENSSIAGFLERTFVEPYSWGPKTTILGEGFNIQPGGQSSFWVKLPRVENNWVLWLGGYKLRPDRSKRIGLISSVLPVEIGRMLVATPGEFPLYLVDYVSRTR